MMRVIVWLLTIGSLLAGFQEPRWSQKYQEGLQLLNQERYYEAMGALALAAAENPRSAASPRYTPFFYLGVCYDKLGDSGRALEYYARELKSDALQSFPSDLQTAEQRVEALLLTQDYDLIITQPGATRADPPPEMVDPSPAPDQPEPAPPAPVTAPPERETRPSPPPAQPAPPPAESRVEDAAPVAEATLRRNLRTALSLFLAGDYPGALLQSRPLVEGEDGDFKETAAFIAGASLYAQYLLAGSQNEGLREEALYYFRQCGAYDPPDSWISPAILDFYRQR